MSDQSKPHHPIHVQLDETTARGAYVNMARIFHTQTEFVVDALFLPPASHHARVVSRLVLNPVHAKHLLRALQHNIQKYEQTFGEIRIPGNDTPPDPFMH
jgi:hypothetical protein